MKNSGKIKQVGADAIVSPSFIGGLRMASEMIRPTAVSFLDLMLRDKERNLRVEEVAVPDPFAGKAVSALNLKEYLHLLLLAVKTEETGFTTRRLTTLLNQGTPWSSWLLLKKGMNWKQFSHTERMGSPPLRGS